MTDHSQPPVESALFVCIIGYAPSGELGRCLLDGTQVRQISPALTADVDLTDAKRLARKWVTYSQGTDLYGGSFKRSIPDWELLISKEPELRHYLRPYVNAKSLCNSPTFASEEWVVDFGDRDLGDLAEVEDAVGEISRAVMLERSNQTKQVHEHRDWLHWDKRLAAYEIARRRDRVLVCPNVSKHLPMAFVDSQFLLSKTVKFFPDAGFWEFAVLQSAAFVEWVFATSRRRGKGVEFSSRASTDTFVPPPRTERVALAGEELERLRSEVLTNRHISLTELMNRVHERSCRDEDIEAVREAQFRLDGAVFKSYGWDFSPQRDHRTVTAGSEYSLSPASRQRLLESLLSMNHYQYDEEVVAGLHKKKFKKSTTRRASNAASKGQGELL